MTAISITPGYPNYSDTDGSALNDGYVYIGLEYQNPITAPTGAFWDKDFKIPADQPLRTSGGYIVRNGTPAAVYTGAAYSILVQNKNLVTVYNAPSAVITNVTNTVEDITQYQGAHPTDPLARNDGTPLQVGDLYFNSTINELKVWTGSVWAPTSPGNVAVQNFTGTGSQTAFTLSAAPIAENNTQIYIDGVYQQKDTYAVAGATINFSAAPPNLSTIEVVSFSIASLGTVDSSNVSYNEGSAGAVTTTVQAKLQESVSVTDFGAVGDGVTDDTVAIQAADASSASQLSIPLGTYIVGTSITITTPIVGDGGILKPSSGVVITLSGDVRTSTLSQLFDISAGGSVKFTVAQDVYPEWWGTANTAIKSAMKSSAAGSRTVLQGKYYETVSIAFDNDPLATDGSDTAKSIEGVNPAQRYSTTGGFFGTRVKLADNQNTAVFTFASGGANSWGTGGLRNLMIEGNKGNQSAGDGIYIDDIKDIEFHNIYIWNCYANGMNLEGQNNQVSITGYMESWNNGNDGIRAAAMGDIQCTESTIRCVNNARYGFYIGTGSGRFNQIYAYFNTNSGIRIETSVDVDLHIDYIRSEDNDLAGLEIRGDNVHINHAYLSDNGYGGTTTGTKQAGVYLHSTSNNIVIDYLSSADRSAGGVTYQGTWDAATNTPTLASGVGTTGDYYAVSVAGTTNLDGETNWGVGNWAVFSGSAWYRTTHNQKFLMYDNSDSGCVVGTMSDRGIVNYAGAGTPRSGYFTNWATLAGCELRSAGVVVESYANLKDAGATLTPDPARFSRYAVSAVSENMTVSNTANTSSPEGCTLALQLTSSGSYNVNWGSAYLSNAGSALSANATTVGQVVNASFIRRAGKWYLEHAISVA